MLANQEQKHV